MSTEPRNIYIQFAADGSVMSATNVSAFCEETNPKIYKEIEVFLYDSAYQALEQKLAVAVEKLEQIKRVNGMMGLGDAIILADEALALIKPTKGDE